MTDSPKRIDRPADDGAASTIRDSSQIRRYYDDKVQALADPYKWRRWEASAVRREHYLQTELTLGRALANLHFDRLVEVGCGPCVWTGMLAAHAAQVTAIDLSLSMLR